MILFFVRRFNDIDHTIPIVYRLAKDGYKEMALLALDPDFDLKNDFRLNFLKNEYAITIDHVYKYFAPSFVHRFLAGFICNSGHNGFSIMNKLNRVFRALLKDHYKNSFLKKLVFKRVFGEEWAKKMFLVKEVRLLVFDWQRLGKFITLSLSAAAKKLNVPILAIPHGISLYTNENWTVSSFSNDTLLDFGDRWKDFDAILVQFERYRQTVIRAGVPAEKLHVLGSTRFCREWEEIYQKLIPDSGNYSKNGGPGRVKVVFMDHNPMYRLAVDNIVDTIERLIKLDFVDLVIKPSTSSRKAITSMKFYDMAIVDFETSSVELVKWADVVMGTTSSILIEPLLMGKTFIYPKYFHENNMLWDEMGACWTVNNYEEMEGALRKIAKEPACRPYTDSNVDKFVTEVIYGGIPGRDVLGDYRKYILSLI